MNKWNRVRSFGVGTAALLAAALASTPAFAQEEAPSLNNGALTFSLGVDLPTAYVFRGYEVENAGLIVQPYAEVGIGINDEFSAYFGTWNTLHSNDETAVGSSNEFWFEQDVYAGVTYTGLDPVTLEVQVVGYYYPNGNFTDYYEIIGTVAYDDSALWESAGVADLALNPYATIAFEFATDDNSDEDNIYFELGAEWSTRVLESEDYPVDLSVPLTLGFSFDDFYVDDNGDNEFWGFVSIGANAAVPLTFIPTEYGSWSAGAGLTFYWLNDDANLRQGEEQDFMLVGTLGISMEY